MIFYPSKNNNRLNRRAFTPEGITGTAMVNPHYRVDLAPGTRYVIDSGAFQERDMVNRLEPWQALDRQLRLEAQIEYGPHGGPAEALITYDMLAGVDEALEDGQRVKRRGTPETAQRAVFETIRSAQHYARERSRIRGAVAYACQGVGVAQYSDCARALLNLMDPARDWFAFGGLCITGLMRGRMLPVFEDTLRAVFPLLTAAGVKRAHILGVCLPDAIAIVRELEKATGIVCSTDASAPEQAAVFGRAYTNGDGRQVFGYTRAQKYIDYHPCKLAEQNITDYTTWLGALE